MEYLPYLAAPIVCAFIGWLTNYIAVKMLFYPKQPIFIFGWRFQGVFPKRQQALAENIGEMVQNELISHEDITAIMQDPALHAKFRETIAVYVDMFLQEKLTGLNPMIGMVLNGQMLEKVKTLLINEIDGLIPEVIDSAAEELEHRLDFKELVRSKVESFSMDKLEDILMRIMRNEFQFIELVGAVLGFVIGTFQAGLFYFL